MPRTDAIQVQNSRSRKLSKSAVNSSTLGCPETPLLPTSQVNDSVGRIVPVLDAHKDIFVGGLPIVAEEHSLREHSRSYCRYARD